MTKDKNNGLAYDKSFTLKITNTTNYQQEIQLFQLGGDDVNSVRNVLAFSKPSYQYGIFPPQQTSSHWTSYIDQPFYVFNEVGAILNSYPTINDFFWRTTGNLELVTDNDIGGGTLAQINVPLTNGMTIEQVNEAIRLEILNSASTDDFRNSNGDLFQFEFFVDIAYINTLSLPIDTTQPNFYGAYGFTMQYPQPNDLEIGSTGNPIRLSAIITPELITGAWEDIEGAELVNTSSINGVEVIGKNNISYQEIIESQNGGVIDIKSLDINIGSSLNEDTIKGQLLQPFLFDQRDVNGNDRTYVTSPTIDPYQYQNSYKTLNLNGDSGNKFVLDSTSELRYTIEPLTSLNITFNYVLLRNFLFGLPETMENLKRDLEEIDKYDNDEEEKIEDVEIVSGNENTNKIIKKSKKSIPLFKYGIGAILFLLLLTNKKQKK